MTYILAVFLDDVRVSYGNVNEYFDGGDLILKANEWAGKDNWNRLELTIEEAV